MVGGGGRGEGNAILDAGEAAKHGRTGTRVGAEGVDSTHCTETTFEPTPKQRKTRRGRGNKPSSASG